MNELAVNAIRTRVFHTNENLSGFILEHIQPGDAKEGMILAITSKIVSLAEGRLVPAAGLSKRELVVREADHDLGEVGYGHSLTIKHGLFIPSAGIDESNSEDGDFILYPEDPFKSLKKLWTELRAAWCLSCLGLIMTDSRTTPLRRGVTGISLAHWGFKGVRSLVGAPDLFGRELKVTSVNLADSLAAAATLTMGEANEARPLALIRVSNLDFTDETDAKETSIPLQDDLYYPIFKGHL